MVRRLCILFLLVALWPGLGLAQSAALMEALNQYQALLAQGRYAEAEPFAVEALRLSEKKFGPAHPTTTIFLNNLAALYQAHGRYDEAEPLHMRSLAIDEKALGPKHPGVPTDLKMNIRSPRIKTNSDTELSVTMDGECMRRCHPRCPCLARPKLSFLTRPADPC